MFNSSLDFSDIWWHTITDIIILLIEPKYSGNIGAVARSMMNFDVSTLYLVNPCKIDDASYIRAVHATSILDSASIFSSFDEAIQSIDLLIGTSSIDTISEKKHLRNPLYPKQLFEKISEVEGTIGLVFGREDYGLFNHELAACDIMMKIPTSPAYPALNLSHAVTIVLYELFSQVTIEPTTRRSLDSNEKQLLFETFSTLLDTIHYPEHKKEKTIVMFKRIMGRALPSKWEYHSLMGVLKTASKQRMNHRNQSKKETD